MIGLEIVTFNTQVCGWDRDGHVLCFTDTLDSAAVKGSAYVWWRGDFYRVDSNPSLLAGDGASTYAYHAMPSGSVTLVQANRNRYPRRADTRQKDTK